MSLRPLVLLTPSHAAAVELPRRVASTGRAIAGVYAMKPLDLARALAEPVLLGRGLAPWTSGHDALLAARLLAETDNAGLRFPEGTPRAPVAAALARTLAALRRAGIAAGAPREPRERAGRQLPTTRVGLPRCRGSTTASTSSSRAASPTRCDPGRRARRARARALARGGRRPDRRRPRARARRDRVRRSARRALPGARAAAGAAAVAAPQSFRGRLAARGVSEADWAETPLAAAAPASRRRPLLRLREWLFEPPAADSAGRGRSRTTRSSC